MSVPAQSALNQDAYMPRHEIRWAVLSGSMYQPPALPFHVPDPISEQASQTQPSSLGSWERNGEANLQQTAAPSEQQGIRSFPTLEALYSVANPIAIESFLQNHTQLMGLLFSAFPRIKSTWGAEARPELSLVDDPEGGFPLLIVRIVSSAPNAHEALDSFDEEWWLDHISDAEGLMNFSLRVK